MLAIAALALLAGLVAPSVRSQSAYSTPYYFTTFAGSGLPGSADGTGGEAGFSFPAFLALDGSGNLYVADGYNQTIRKITPAGVVTTVAGKAGVPGANDGTSSTARFHGPIGVAVDRSGTLFVTEAANGTVRKITPAGDVTTVAGGFRWPWGVAVDGEGNLFVVELGNHTVRKITSSGVVTTLAGVVGSPGGADGTGSGARFNQPTAIVVDASGNLLVSDGGNAAIRKITADGVVTTFAGTLGSRGFIDGTGSAAGFQLPTGLAIDPDGNIFVVDTGTETIRKISSSGVVTTVAGLAGRSGRSNGAGEQARFNFPIGIALDATGMLYVADSDNNTIRRSVLPPAVTLSPANQNVNPGVNLQIAAHATSEFPVQFQWRIGGIDIPGATGSTLDIDAVQVSQAGNYSVAVTSAAGSVTSDAATLTVNSDAIASRLANISVRTSLAADEIVTVGIAIDGGTRDVLVRAVGPALIPLGVSQAVLDPRLELFNGGTLVLANDDWPAALAPTFASVGAFAFPIGGRDAAFRRDLNGAYSIQARGTGSGVVLVEAYAVGEDHGARLINVSARNRVGTGVGVLIAGFTVSGAGARQLLIRAVGPGLARSGVSDRLVDPKLELYGSAGARLGENDNWPASLAATFGRVGAFELPVGSRDAALLTALLPGSYSVQVKGADGGVGEALVEIYEVR